MIPSRVFSPILPFPPANGGLDSGVSFLSSLASTASNSLGALPLNADAFIRSGVSSTINNTPLPTPPGLNNDNTPNPITAIPSQWYVSLGDHDYQANRFPEALTAFNRAIILNPNNYQAYNKRGVVYAALRDYPAAIADYTKAIALNPGFYNAYLNRGNLWMQARDPQRALADYSQAIRINPMNRAAYENRSELYSNMGARQLALADKAMIIRLRQLMPSTIPSFLTKTPPRLALVLANDDYPGQENDLDGGPLADAAGMQLALQKSGFDVMAANNLTGPQTKAYIKSFVQRLQANPGAVSVIYYSGHGGAVQGNNYLLPTNFDGDADADFRNNAVSVDYMLQQLKNASSAFNILFLDACRTPLPAATTMFKSLNTTSNGFNSLSLPPSPVLKQWETEPGPGLSNTWIEYASRPDKPALQAQGRGLYTKYLLYYMMQPNLNLEDVSMYTSYALEQDPEGNSEDQHARTQTDLSKTEPLAESFYFLRPGPLAVAVPASA
jgi:tetratricopeptide (TPR) repeat protein